MLAAFKNYSPVLYSYVATGTGIGIGIGIGTTPRNHTHAHFGPRQSGSFWDGLKLGH